MKNTGRRTGVALAVVAISIAGTTVITTNDVARSAVATALSDPLAVLAGRSPGARPAGSLTQTKPSRELPRTASAVPPFVPTERMLSGERVPEAAVPVSDSPFGETGLPGAPADVFPGVAPGGSGGRFFSPPLSFNIPPVGGGGGTISPPTGSSGGTVVPPTDGSSGGTVVPPTGSSSGGTVVPPTGSSSGGTVVPPTPPVPEPATWAMMIIGFMSIAASLRRRGRRVRQAAIDALGPR